MWKVYLSRWVNYYLLGGKPNQMISSRVYIEHHVRCERFINRLFFWQDNHCRQSYIWEVVHEKTHKKSTRTQEAEEVAQPSNKDAMEA